MSRASDLRDGIVAALKIDFPDEVVEAVVIPDHTREDIDQLTSKRLIMVRSETRDLIIEQGPNTKNVTIQVGVVGVLPSASGGTVTPTSFRASQVAAADVFDGLFEEVIGLWLEDEDHPARLAELGIADHRFVAMEQDRTFDVTKLYASGLWVAVVNLTYQDARD